MKRVKLNIAGTDYGHEAIVSLRTHRALFDGAPTVGNCVSGELDATLWLESSKIPRNAKLTPYISDDGAVWQKKSDFFVYSRRVDKETGAVELTAYDAIFKAEAPYAQPGNVTNWPRADITVMREIAQRTGTAICADTIRAMNKRYNVQFPGIIIEEDGAKSYQTDGSTTMREVAGRIAAMYAGNWIIDNNGEWRLAVLGDIPEETNLLITEDGEYIRLGDDRILIVTDREETQLLVVEDGRRIRLGNDRILLEFGKTETHVLAVDSGDALLIGGDRLIV